MNLRRTLATGALVALSATAAAQQPAPSPAPATAIQTQTTTLPAHGLFEGDRLSAAARQKLADLIVNALGLQVEVALVVPTGPWRIDGSGKDERDLTPARLEAVKRFLADRGVDPKKIYVESRVDDKLKEPRLDVQILGRNRND